MAATTVTQPPLKRRTKACFSFAAYSKDLIANLHHHSNVPIANGLTQSELTHIESSFNFSFPPDLRSILREGLPVGQGFPNWRSSSPQQLDILINLPIMGLCKEVYRKKFWHRRWGGRPEDDDEAVELAKRFLKKLPVLVPVYQNCYIPTFPGLAGNPVFYVNGFDIKLCSYDVVGFFQQTEFNERVVKVRGVMRLSHLLSAPVWAATEARRIEFWTELVEIRRGWCGGSELRRCLEDVRLRLRDGGWKEEDVDDMMTMMEMNGGDARSSSSTWSSSDDDDGGGVTKARDDREAVGWHVMVLSKRLLRGGWSRGDVVDSLGCLTEVDDDRAVEIDDGDGGDSLFDFEHITYSCVDDSQTQSASVRPVLRIHANNKSIVV